MTTNRRLENLERHLGPTEPPCPACGPAGLARVVKVKPGDPLPDRCPACGRRVSIVKVLRGVSMDDI
jgi:uncharacterized Zn finger protein